ncbi:AAA-like domain-containing protein [Nostoc sp. CENA67]|uniref:AAA-like domain-containing protein n=1 Tax=Amazonocrinis nigriterrae CENA67 TaxID=2794033 RepID=A0A8J7HYX2_9NOST|nr:AAA-like domain-containing protein [Amazonocrinis nigriterrae]MBH8565064.1 AAA-like domain-containing protein [Amazonocrinis nigriterrae CENA67]
MNFEETRKVVEAAIQEHEHRHLTDVELTILRGSWEGQTYDEMAKSSMYEASYLKGDAGHKFWKLLTEVLGEPVSKRNFRAVVERSQFSHKVATSVRSLNLTYTMKYVQHPRLETLCQQEILQPGSLLKIKAPPKMGKTLHLSMLINYAEKVQGYRAVDLKLRLAEKADFENLDKFLRWFCSSITQMLNQELDHKIDEHWNQQLGNSKLKCMKYFEDYLLNENEPPLVLGLDDVDRVFQNPEIAGDFFNMLRSWHEKARTREIWGRFRLIVTYTEYTLLDITNSPFYNVGEEIELPELSADQIKDLANMYELDWNDDQVNLLMNMVGGHPYLVREAIEHVQRWGMQLEEILKIAPTEAGIYSEFLQENLWNLQQNLVKYPEMNQALKQLVTVNSPVKLESNLASKLYEIGLVKRQGNDVEPRCQLYRLYFQERLKDTQ